MDNTMVIMSRGENWGIRRLSGNRKTTKKFK